ncbi:Gfo/Idh/MocA family oxidoreductase [Lachnospiraceae bacterium ZAX-1]
MMDHKIRLGVIGTGLAWDKLHWPVLQKLTDKYEIRAVCNRTIEKAQKFADTISLAADCVYSDYSELLLRDDIDAVDVLVPISESFKIAKDVLLAGKHLIAEKPFASSPEAAQKLIVLKNAKGLNVLIAENFLYDEEVQIIKSLLEGKSLGKPLYFIQNSASDLNDNPFMRTPWRQVPAFFGGNFLDGGIHDIARIRYLFGDVRHLDVLAQPPNTPFVPHASINALMGFDSGIFGMYAYLPSAPERTDFPVGFRIFCEKGEIYLESRSCGKLRVFHHDGRVQEIAFTPDAGYYLEMVNFWDALYNEAPILATPEVEVGDIKLVFEILNLAKKDL